MWFPADNDITLSFDYLQDGQLVVPASASYVVRDHSGATIDSGALPAAATSESVTVSAANNALSNGALIENRFLTVLFVVSGGTYHFQKSYSLHGFIPMTVSPQDTRRELGLDTSELPDADVDLVSAYFHLEDLHGTSFTDAFTDTDIQCRAANQAVAVQAALNLIPSLQLRAAKAVRSEDSEFHRVSKLDFESLRHDLNLKAADLLATAKGVTTVTPDIFVLSTPTDAVTG